MPAPYNPPWGRGSSGRRASQANPNMRVSHAERTEVADRLSKHYGDGRLDEEEFNERLDRAMKAKTQSDLDGLFDDLPEPETPRSVTRPNPQPHPRGPRPLPGSPSSPWWRCSPSWWDSGSPARSSSRSRDSGRSGSTSPGC